MTKFKLEKKETTVEVKISSNSKEWKSYLEKAKKRLIANLELKGFRKGKVPLEIALKNISMDEVRNDAANMLLDANHEEALNMLLKENIATRPSFSIVKISDDEVEATLKAMLMPDIKLGNRDSIKVSYKEEKVKDSEIKEEVEKIKKYLIENKEISDSSKTIENGDIANIDYLGKLKDKPFEGGEGKDFDLVIGSKSFIDNFEEQLIGMKKGDEKTISVKFPNEYPSEELKGKSVTFDVKINSLKTIKKLSGEKLKSKLNSLGFDSEEDITRKITAHLEDQKKTESNEKFFREYIDKVIKLKDTVLVIPKEIVAKQVEDEWKRIEMQILQQNMKVNDYLKMIGLSKKEFKEQNLLKASEKRVREGMVYSKLMEILKIKVTPEEIEKDYKRLAKLNKMTVEEIKKEISAGSLEDNLGFDKLVDKLKK